jgi:hypothetical protein
MNIRKIIFGVTAAAVLMTGVVSLKSLEARESMNLGPMNQEEQFVPYGLSVANDLDSEGSIEVFIEDGDGPWGDPGNSNCVISQPVTQNGTISAYTCDEPHRVKTLLSYRYQGKLYQYEVREVLNHHKRVRLSEFVPQEQDNYPYGQ